VQREHRVFTASREQQQEDDDLQPNAMGCREQGGQIERQTGRDAGAAVGRVVEGQDQEAEEQRYAAENMISVYLVAA